MIKLTDILKEVDDKPSCPIATQNIAVNLKNRQTAIDRYGYGPLNPNNPNIKFWKEKADMWKLDTIEEAKDSRCNNCAAFNITQRILNCIEKGIGAGEKEVPIAEQEDIEQAPETETDTEKDAWDTIEAGKLGYCTFLKFKCAGSRTCSAWVVGGPVKDK